MVALRPASAGLNATKETGREFGGESYRYQVMSFYFKPLSGALLKPPAMRVAMTHYIMISSQE